LPCATISLAVGMVDGATDVWLPGAVPVTSTLKAGSLLSDSAFASSSGLALVLTQLPGLT
jgi:hypothetical protein